MGYVYKITNDVNGKIYIGKTLGSIEKRFAEHLSSSDRESHEKRPLYRAMKKYGKEHFSISLLEECNDEELSDRERYWIQKYDSNKNGYNATAGGDGKPLFNREQILQELLFSPCLVDVSRKIGCSVDVVRDVAREHGINVLPPNPPHYKKPVVGFSIHNTQEYMIFESCASAAEWLHENGICKSFGSGERSHISDAAKGKRKSAYGYIWRYY